MPQSLIPENISILEGPDKLTHWTGSPSFEGGAIKKFDVTPVGGPPSFDVATEEREPYKFTVETLILGATRAEQDAFIARYAPGRELPSSQIIGGPPGITFFIESALPKFSRDAAATLAITLHEKGQAAPATP